MSTLVPAPRTNTRIKEYWSPSTIWLSTAATGNRTEAWPAGITSVAGTITLAALVLTKSTTTELAVTGDRVTVPSVASGPSLSLILVEPSVTMRFGKSVSKTVTTTLVGTNPPARTVMVFKMVPSAVKLSTASTGKD